MKTQVAVIGGGAAGLLCAGVAAGRGLHVTVIEKNDRPARKVLVTGKGRCNLTNQTDLQGLIQAVPTNGRFLYSAFCGFGPQDMMELMERLGVPVKVERGNRVFPVSDRAMDVADALVKFAKQNGAQIMTDTAQGLEITGGRISGVQLKNNGRLCCEAAVVATGGLSYPKTGSTGDGYGFARQAGHTVIPPSPSLVPLTVHEGDAAAMQGLSLRNVGLTVVDTLSDKTVYTDFGELLFTHFGLSGPVILSASAHLRPMRPARYRVQIDLKPALNEQTLDARLLRDFGENTNRDFANALGGLLPRKMIPVIVARSGIAPHQKVHQITRAQREQLLHLIKGLTFTVTGFRPVEEAIVTAGGVDVRQVDPKTMASKLCNNLYFAGEVLDVDAYTGGFNLQIAFSTGYAAGSNVLYKAKS